MAYYLINTATLLWTTALLWITSATGLDPSDLLSFPGQSIDLLSSLGLYNSSWVGVTLTEGPSQIRPAYLLQEPPQSFENKQGGAQNECNGVDQMVWRGDEGQIKRRNVGLGIELLTFAALR
ncbi:unnamed protein product [Acanthoscelides obtectus]|uniref:Uncharacterized protein n=1 Tax=Acanthoscelides obtectus TaxID=200917 RepID=A0A9P0JLW1_ACAOB|nr:unnamed protein product [Acanthoscelides obtectus]CAK1661533.1 hypothetical protein AOBTE_LOCUS22671 [Acanthoscelides obtectus]